MAVLSKDAVKAKLEKIEGWKYEDGMIHREVTLKDFVAAINFTHRAGEEAEKINHHPDILIHSYNKVKFSIMSHDEGGITEKDFELASRINNLV